MSVQATSFVHGRGPKKANRVAHFVLLTIADVADRDGSHAHPGIAALIDQSTFGRSAVIAALGWLEENGWIEIEEYGGGRGMATVYRIPGVSDPEWQPGPRRVQTLDGSRADAGRPSEHADPCGLDGFVHEPSTSSKRTVQPSGTSPHTQRLSATYNGARPPAASEVESFPPAVVRLCTLLADLIEGNGSRRPVVTVAWLTECERMLRIDERDPVEAEGLIRWTQANAFWRSNILSMPKFREKYDALRLRRLNDRGGSPQGQVSPFIVQFAQEAERDERDDERRWGM